MMKNLLKTVFVLFLSASAFGATITENFDTFTTGSYGNYTYNGWEIIDGFAETDGAHQYMGTRGVRLDDDAGAGIISPSKLGGIGDISFWYRNWSSPAIDFYVYTSPDSTTWTVVDSVKGLLNTTFINYTKTINDPSAKFMKIVSSGQKMLILDEFTITDASVGCTGYYIDSIATEICAFDSVEFRGSFYKTDGIYKDTVTASCDTIFILNLSTTIYTMYDVADTICSLNDSLLFNGEYLKTAGIYYDTTTRSGMCDSITKLTLATKYCATPCADLFISEYIEGGSLNKAVEIYNPTSSPINLAQYKLVIFTSSTDSIQLAGTLASGDVYVVSHSGADLTNIISNSDTAKVLNFNGDDKIELVKLGNVIDRFGDDVPAGNFAKDQTFQRKQTIKHGTLNFSATDWNIFSQNTDSYLGAHESDCICVGTNDTITETICQGGSYMFDGQLRTTTGFYRDSNINAQGCDSVIVLNLTVSDYLRDTLDVTICHGGSIVFDSQTLTMAGLYSDTVQTSGGCDSISVLNLTIGDYLRDTITSSLCTGDSIYFDGAYIKMSGVYSDTAQTAGGCDSISVLNLTVDAYIKDTISATICQGGSILFDGQTLTMAGYYSDTVPVSGGCDSISVLNLTVSDYLRDTLDVTICHGGSIVFDSQTLTMTGYYSDTVQTSGGCDSISVLNLTVGDYLRDTLDVTICHGGSIVFDSQTLTMAGLYSDTVQTSGGCDSISVLNLTVGDYLRDTLDVTICHGGSIVFDSQTLTMAGYYSDTVQTSGGCDSISVLNLTVGDYLRDTLDANICDGNSYMFDGQTLTMAGYYSDTVQTTAGCDSISVLNLTVTTIDNSVTVTGLTITANDAGANTTYVWVDCDNNYAALSPAETGQSFTATTSGNYAVILTNGSCSDTSACTSLTTTGVNETNNEIGALIYPNPTNDIVNVKVSKTDVYTLTVMDLTGKVVMSETVTNQLTQLDFNGYDSGIYFITLNNKTQKTTFKLTVK